MSAIASFYVVENERLTDIVAAATSVSGGWFRPARDTFWDVLRGSGRELATFASRLGVQRPRSVSRKSARVHVRQFRRGPHARGSDWVVLPAASVVELLAALDGVECEAGDVREFVASEYGPEGTAEEAAAVQAALTTLKAWLAEVSPRSAGLLSVG